MKCTPKISYSSGGLKIFLDNLENYKALIEVFKKENIPFHTHPLKDEKPINQVIKGLPNIDAEIIKK